MDNRTPKNLQELLKFAIKHQQDDNKNCVEFDEDKKIFLDQVLESMTVNVMEEFLKAINTLLEDSSSAQDKVDALVLIRDYIDNIDFANSFIKMKDADILVNCVKHTNHDVCINAINIVAEMSQNNIICQKYFLQYDIIEQLTKFLSNDDFDLVASSLYALSALTRHFEPALTEFIKNGGIKCVADCLCMKSLRVFIKSCSLIISMSSEFSLVKDEFAKLDVISNLTKKLRVVNCFDLEIDMTLHTMSVLIKSRYCNPNKDEIEYITNILKSISKNNKNLPECEEIVMYSNSLLQHLDS